MGDRDWYRLTTLTTCGGCASKASPSFLAGLVTGPGAGLPLGADANLLVGLETPDDAAVYRVGDGEAVVATVDFFAPLVDDPYTYGAIAAANAMSDVFAMGGEVTLALNVTAFPEELPREVAAAILRGGAEKVAEAGGVVAGGHTVWDDEPKYGLSVLGRVDPARLFSKAGLRAGDALYLTKPVGVGVLISAAKGEPDHDAAAGAAIASMLRLNRAASRAMREAGVAAATDVTGFGLLGHLWEMASRSGVAVEVAAGAVPLLDGAAEVARRGVCTGGGQRNEAWVGGNATFEAAVAPHLPTLLFDPQTSGGLLCGCPEARAGELEQAFARAEQPLWRIGSVGAGEPRIQVRE